MKNKYLTVLDFEVKRVFQYKLEKPHLNNDGVVDHEEFIGNKGHRLNNCEWMAHEVDTIILDNEKGYDSRVYYNE